MHFLLDLWSTISYVTSFVAVHFGFDHECISTPFFISTPLDDSVVARRVYRGCVVSVGGQYTLVDMFELYMVDFYVILWMDWLYWCYASLDYQTRKVVFKFSNVPIIEW